MTKNNRTLKGTVTMRRPEVAFSVLVGKKVCEKRYKYESAPALPHCHPADAVTQADVGVSAPPPEIDLQGIATTRQAAAYYFQQAGMVGKPCADHELLDYCLRTT